MTPQANSHSRCRKSAVLGLSAIGLIYVWVLTCPFADRALERFCLAWPETAQGVWYLLGNTNPISRRREDHISKKYTALERTLLGRGARQGSKTRMTLLARTSSHFADMQGKLGQLATKRVVCPSNCRASIKTPVTPPWQAKLSSVTSQDRLV
jgi:hypothetical protein